MRATELPVTITLPEPKTPRSKGVHVSGIIRCIATEAGILKYELAEDLSLVDVRTITDPVALLRINIGLAWEEHYIPMLHDVLDHPDEMRVDGVYMSPDGESVNVIITESFNGMALIVHECKATYKSTKTVGDLTNQWMWLAQIMAYCKGKNTTVAKLHVLFLCGDYKFPIRPILKCWLIEFTQEEVDENWKMLMSYKEYREELEEEMMA